jgi:hypothetical protein
MRGLIAACAAASAALTMFASAGSATAKGFGLYRAHFSSRSSIGLYRAHNDHRRYTHDHGRGRHGRHNGYGYGYGFLPSVDDDLMPLYAGPTCQKTEETVIVPSEGGGERTVRITRC